MDQGRRYLPIRDRELCTSAAKWLHLWMRMFPLQRVAQKERTAEAVLSEEAEGLTDRGHDR